MILMGMEETLNHVEQKRPEKLPFFEFVGRNGCLKTLLAISCRGMHEL